ncbi:hypothetical protein FZEAL_9724 [Fusarium zealandicum]|uniref:Uncharacterized protein n=1 Tax=Fusarium zealandicum TaxID=1053134 RepID=A0A8H4XE70_9HYPO|nr:hypothetical protein FZEAL_9724 [Fusarium zealandicum]
MPDFRPLFRCAKVLFLVGCCLRRRKTGKSDAELSATYPEYSSVPESPTTLRHPDDFELNDDDLSKHGILMGDWEKMEEGHS